MPGSSVVDILVLTFVWFIVYWILAGIIFAIIGFVRLRHIHAARFSCLFTFLSAATAFGAVWTGFIATANTSPECLNRVHVAYRALVGLFKCATAINISNGILWFVVLLLAGLGAMYISRIADRPRPPQY